MWVLFGTFHMQGSIRFNNTVRITEQFVVLQYQLSPSESSALSHVFSFYKQVNPGSITASAKSIFSTNPTIVHRCWTSLGPNSKHHSWSCKSKCRCSVSGRLQPAHRFPRSVSCVQCLSKLAVYDCMYGYQLLDTYVYQHVVIVALIRP